MGGISVELTVVVPHHARPGETVLGGDSFEGPGGKGANQAVAAARFAAGAVPVAMVGRVGDDTAGLLLRESLARAGIDVTHVGEVPGTATGRAVVTVDAAGESCVVLSPGANAHVDVRAVATAADQLRAAAITLLQLEIPLPAVAAAIRATGGAVVLSPGPATVAARELLAGADVLVPDLSELATLSERAGFASLEDVAQAARRLRGPGVIVVMLGAHGALVVEGAAATHVEQSRVDAVDSKGAGDAFCGALAVSLAEGVPLVAAARTAATAAALSTTRPGAQASLATRAEVDTFAAIQPAPPH